MSTQDNNENQTQEKYPDSLIDRIAMMFRLKEVECEVINGSRIIIPKSYQRYKYKIEIGFYSPENAYILCELPFWVMGKYLIEMSLVLHYLNDSEYPPHFLLDLITHKVFLIHNLVVDVSPRYKYSRLREFLDLYYAMETRIACSIYDLDLVANGRWENSSFADGIKKVLSYSVLKPPQTTGAVKIIPEDDGDSAKMIYEQENGQKNILRCFDNKHYNFVIAPTNGREDLK